MKDFQDDFLCQMLDWILWGLFVCLVIGIAWVFAGCKTLDTLKEEGRAIGTEVVNEFDALGADLIKTYADKVRKEIARGRVKLSHKIKMEIYRFAVKNGIKTAKPLTPREIKEVIARVRIRRNMPEMQRILNAGRPEQGRVYKYTPKPWKPSEATKKAFWARNKRAKGVTEAQQFLWMAMWEAKFDFLFVTGHRSCAEQERLFNEGKSKIKSCTGQHNLSPAQAVDFVNMEGKKALFNDRVRLATTAQNSREVWCSLKKQYPKWAHLNWRWGGDWRNTNRQKKNSFEDFYHIELRPDTPDTCLERFLL